MKQLLLNGIWEMNGAGLSCTGTIPGSVYSFLLDNELMEDPFYRENELKALELMENDFTFTRKFDFNKSKDKVLLRCEGLDTLCEIYMNGSFVAYTDNMHRLYEFDVTDILVEGENEIKLVFLSINKYIKAKEALEPTIGAGDALAGSPHIRKATCMMGWDWGARLPDVGIWKNISLVTVDSDRICEVHITQRHDNGRVYVTPEVKSELGAAEVRVTVKAPDGQELSVPANAETEIENPMLWWPNGFGEANLYTFVIELIEDGEVVDSDEKRIGLRTIKLIRENDEWGQSFCHEVNGVRIFAMGADYVPEDNVLSRITKERTYKLLEQCASCNFNTIRVWGGGFYPHEFFFDACDELGLLVFEDLMFACMNVPDNQELTENILIEIRENLTRIRHHACLAVICGNNEMELGQAHWWNGIEGLSERRAAYIRMFEHLLADISKEVCPYIPYVPSSPTSFGSFIEVENENYGDSHYWEVWHGGKPFSEYRKHYFRYLSEFGYESFPCEKTVNAFTKPEDRNIFSRVMERHQRCSAGNKKILNYMGDTFLYTTDFPTLLYASQLLQAEAIRFGVEHMRRHRGRCMGALYWQLNDMWPVASWASIDYYGRFKALQYVAKRFFAPVMISCKEIGETYTRAEVFLEEGYYDYSTEAQLCVANETMSEVKGIAKWELRSSDSAVLKSGSQEVAVPALSSVWLENMDFNKTDILNNYMSFSFEVDGEVVSEGSVLFTAPKYFNFQNPNLRYEINGDEITVYADSFAKYVEIDSLDSDFILSDNYFDMNAGSKTVKILEGTPKSICLRSVYDIR